jgi:hypothetical protein
VFVVAAVSAAAGAALAGAARRTLLQSAGDADAFTSHGAR